MKLSACYTSLVASRLAWYSSLPHKVGQPLAKPVLDSVLYQLNYVLFS